MSMFQAVLLRSCLSALPINASRSQGRRASLIWCIQSHSIPDYCCSVRAPAATHCPARPERPLSWLFIFCHWGAAEIQIPNQAKSIPLAVTANQNQQEVPPVDCAQADQNQKKKIKEICARGCNCASCQMRNFLAVIPVFLDSPRPGRSRALTALLGSHHETVP
jgi:hypothetical protein